MLAMQQSAGTIEPIVAAFLGNFSWDYVRKTNISEAHSMAGVSSPVSRARFQTEEDKISSFLKERHAAWILWLENEIETQFETTGAGLEIVAEVLQRGLDDSKCFDLAFMDVDPTIEALNEGPRVIAEEQRDHLKRFLEKLAVRMGLECPDIAASAAVHVIEYTIASMRTTGGLREARTARLLFQCLQHA